VWPGQGASIGGVAINFNLYPDGSFMSEDEIVDDIVANRFRSPKGANSSPPASMLSRCASGSAHGFATAMGYGPRPWPISRFDGLCDDRPTHRHLRSLGGQQAG
jgi:hypothetical protein